MAAAKGFLRVDGDAVAVVVVIRCCCCFSLFVVAVVKPAAGCEHNTHIYTHAMDHFPFDRTQSTAERKVMSYSSVFSCWSFHPNLCVVYA